MVKPYIHDAFDMGILRQDATTKVGLMLRRSQNEVPFYQVFDDEYLAAQYFIGEPSYGNLPPEKELALRQDDWRAGFGIEVYDGNNPKQYFSSIGMDMRFRGKAIAGPVSTGIAIPSYTRTAPAIVNADMELNSDWTGGAQSAAQAHGGTKSWLTSAGDETSYQDLVLTGYPGRYVTFTCWLYQAVANTNVITIDDGVGTTSSSLSATINNWEKQTVTRRLDQGATRLRIKMVSNAGQAGYWDDAVITVAVGDAFEIHFAEFNSLLFISFGNVLAKLNGTGDGFTEVERLPYEITDMAVFSDDKLYLACGYTYSYWEMTTAEAFTVNTLTVNKFKYFALVRTTVDTMYGADAVNKIRSTVNPANGGTQWSGQTTVDSTIYEINQLFSVGGALYIRKENRPYYLNSSGTVKDDLSPELESLSNSIASQDIIEWLAKLYIPWGDQALLEEDSGILTWRNPADFASGLSDFNGKIFAVYADDRYLYAILDNTTKIEVLTGRLEEIDGSSSWVWHPIHETTLTGCRSCHISNVYQKRLWIASTEATESLYYIPLPIGYADVVNDTNRSFKTGGTMETPWLHANFKSTTKAFPALELVMGHTYNAGRYFTVKYKKLGDALWTTIGNYTGSATSMTQSRFIPVDGSSNNPKATMFKLQFTVVTDDATITPVLLSYHLKAILYPGQREIIACKVYCANEIQLKDGTIDKGSFDTIVATLDEARAATWPVTIYDLDGNTKNVKFLPTPANVPRWSVIANEKQRKFEREYTLLLQIVDLS